MHQNIQSEKIDIKCAYDKIFNLNNLRYDYKRNGCTNYDICTKYAIACHVNEWILKLNHKQHDNT